MDAKPLNIGVIGAGRIGKIHAENLVTRISGVKVVAVADPNQSAAVDLAKKLHIENVYSDYHEILADPTVDAVIICSSTDTHANMMVEAAQAGKHIFCEKPVDHSLEKIDRALEAVSMR
jgi:myo-inositol 2-dehydrogenase/D-chiro-inositol 1-dehydrogenase